MSVTGECAVDRLRELKSKATIGEVLASLLLIFSAAWLPWATLRTANLTTHFGGDPFGWVLVSCSAGCIGLVAISAVWRGSWVYWLEISLGCIAALGSLLLALAKISDANQAANSISAYSHTAFGIGSGLGIAGSVGMCVFGSIRLHTVQGSRQFESRRASDAAAVR
jgi:hypothetical protein